MTSTADRSGSDGATPQREHEAVDPATDLAVTVFARACASRGALEDIGTKWGFLALLALGEGDYRFNALRRRVDGVSEKMLAQTLQTLERDGMVVRDVVTTIPPRVQYSLTPLGVRVAGRIADLTALLEDAVPEIVAAQDRFDHRS
ncbi:helix-turn-helix transcriptional regulator [Nakamurella flavida]|uniref:Helix-turn-helix transcriptional regulator n=1 Tax=Nakamurella flavida TaxID=363630 RepID=A0A938YDF7_9ACTN|nr:helix-turn-helix domain-containing protein [Nakamurella flavida]MBM9475641.1 helix-turn-helix transcriptional regulator [Nakamurella flavida]MDP9778083.1 DNA-binding HxlR family transcriptional regulator [Nakamurella flavida]